MTSKTRKDLNLLPNEMVPGIFIRRNACSGRTEIMKTERTRVWEPLSDIDYAILRNGFRDARMRLPGKLELYYYVETMANENSVRPCDALRAEIVRLSKKLDLATGGSNG